MGSPLTRGMSVVDALDVTGHPAGVEVTQAIHRSVQADGLRVSRHLTPDSLVLTSALSCWGRCFLGCWCAPAGRAAVVRTRNPVHISFRHDHSEMM